jgi:diguanylate cyclase (GGDEF)-like protein
MIEQNYLIILLGVGFFIFLLGLLIGRAGGKSSLRREFDEAERGYRRDLSRANYIASEWKRAVDDLEKENQELVGSFVLLPSLIKELQLSLQSRKLSPVIAQVVVHVFDPEQVLIFFTTRDRKTLKLVYAIGIPPEVTLGYSISFYEGKVGQVARRKMALSAEDFVTETKKVREEIEATHPKFMRTDIAAPMVSGNELLGVISVGGIKLNQKRGKTLLKMIAEVSSISLSDTLLFRQKEEEVNLDGLTTLYNKRYASFILGDAIIEANRRESLLSVFLMDIDYFKYYNDTNGKKAGDELLHEVGKIVKKITRGDDVPARFGGEEFLIIIPDTDEKGAFALAEKIRKKIEGYPFPNAERQPLSKVTVSGGIAVFPEDGLSGAELIQAADDRLYQAKRKGKNRVLSINYTSGRSTK